MTSPAVPPSNSAPRSPAAALPAPLAAQLRARTVAELVDAGFAALRRWPALLFGTGLLFLLPVTVVVAVVGEGAPTPGLVNSGSWPAGLLSVLGFSAASSLMGVPLARGVAYVAAGLTPRWRDCYRIGAAAWASALAVWVAMTVLRAVGLALFGVGLVVVSALGVMVSAVLAFEGGGPLRVLGRGLSLGGASFGRGLGLVLLQLLAGSVVTFAIGLLPLIGLLAAPDRWQRPLAQLLQLGVGLLLCPAAAWSAACLYLDERIRRDGLDLAAQLDDWERPGALDVAPGPIVSSATGSSRG